MKALFKDLLRAKSFRVLIFRVRLFWCVRIRKTLKTTNAAEAFEVTVKHNLKALKHCNDRMELLINPLSVIESIASRKSDAKALVIGPRNEHDLLLLSSHGISWENITGLDLITYSPRIVLGDMHKIPFSDNYFDMVLCGWTLSYSSNPAKACEEMFRVVKPGGIIALGVEYSTLTKEDTEKLAGYSIQEYDKLSERINSFSQVMELFENKVQDVFFQHDAPLKISHTSEGLHPNVSNIATIFSVKK